MTSHTLKLALAVAMGLSAVAAHATEQVTPHTLVEVNGEAIQDTHFMAYSSQRGADGKQLDQQTQMALLNELVSTVMVAQDAIKQGLDKQPQLMAAMDVSRNRILAEAAVGHYLDAHPITDKEVEDAYKAEYGTGMSTEYKARHILLKTEDEAKAVIGELDKGGDFAELAKQKSTGPSGPNGGDLGWFEKGQMVAPFADAVATMKKGAHSATPVMTKFGWHVIKLEDSREKAPPKLEEVRDEIDTQLQRQRVSDYIKSVREHATVKIMEQDKAGVAK